MKFFISLINLLCNVKHSKYIIESKMIGEKVESNQRTKFPLSYYLQNFIKLLFVSAGINLKKDQEF